MCSTAPAFAQSTQFRRPKSMVLLILRSSTCSAIFAVINAHNYTDFIVALLGEELEYCISSARGCFPVLSLCRVVLGEGALFLNVRQLTARH